MTVRVGWCAAKSGKQHSDAAKKRQENAGNPKSDLFALNNMNQHQDEAHQTAYSPINFH
jgi:hypothetical protein